MNRPRGCLAGLALILALLAVRTPTARAQVVGYGGIAYPGPGFGFAYPGHGFPGYIAGIPPYGYGYAVGYPAVDYLGVGYPGYVGVPYGPFGPGYANPLFGLGLTPLGVQSALGERYLLGRGLPAAGRVEVRPVPPSSGGPGAGPGTYRP